jgi:hypothetical protein
VLARLRSLARVPLGDALRGSRMTEVLLMQAVDGYSVAFALAEMDPAFAAREIVLADEPNGRPIDAKEGYGELSHPATKGPPVGSARLSL